MGTVAANQNGGKASQRAAAFRPDTTIPPLTPVNVSSSTAGTYPASEGVGGGYRLVYDQGLFWVFFSDGKQMAYATSSSGLNFGSVTTIRAATDGSFFSVYFSPAAHSVSYAYYPFGTPASKLLYRTGTLNAAGTITWAAAEQTVLTLPQNIRLLQSVIAIDSAGYPWIGYTYFDGTKGTGTPYVVRSSMNNGVWVNATGFPFQLSTTAGTNVIVRPIPLTNGKVLVVYAVDGSKVHARLWNGVSWGAQETASANSVGSANKVAAVSLGDNVYLVYISTLNNIQYVTRMYSSASWSGEITVQTSVPSSTGVTLSIDSSGILYFFWTNPANGHIYFKRIVSGVADVSAFDLVNEAAYGLKNGADLISFNAQFQTYIGLSYSICQNPSTCTGSGVKVRFTFLTLTSIRWQTSIPLNNTVGTIFSIDGFNFLQLPLVINLVSGSSATINATTPVTTTVGKRYVFNNWSSTDGQTSITNPSNYAAPSTSQNVTFNYAIQYQVNITDSAILAGTGPIAIFKDDFETYAASSVPVAGECINSNYLGGGNSGLTAATMTGCNAPLGWVISSSGACTGATYPQSGSPPTGGDCVLWGGNGQMGPNSIAAVVTEQAQSGTKSLKVGASDWAFDKTSPEQDLAQSSLLTVPNAQARLVAHVWLSDAINNNNNVLQFWLSSAPLRYSGGTWFYLPAGGTSFTSLGPYSLKTDSWHTINATVDLSKSTWVSLVIDGVSPFSINGLSAPTTTTRTGTYNFAMGLIPGKTNQSIFSCVRAPSLCGETSSSPTLGLYAYLDNFEIDSIPKALPISDTNSPVVTINGVSYGAQSLPYSVWFNGGETITYSFASLVPSSAVKRYVWNIMNAAQTGTFSVAGGTTVTGAYLAQYSVSFGFLDSSGTTVLSPSSFAVMDSNGTVFTNPGTAWFDAGLTQLTAVIWEQSNVLPASGNPGSSFVVLNAGGSSYNFKINVYKRFFFFTYIDGKTTFTPSQFTYVAPNGTAVTLSSTSNYANILVQSGTSTVTRIAIWGNDVVPNPNPTFDASNSTWQGKIVADIFSVNPSWKDGNLNALTVPITSYKWAAPNGTLIGPLTPGTPYWIQNGTTTLSSVIWEGTDVTPSRPTFDAISCLPVVNCSPVISLNIFYLRLDHVDTGGNPLAVNIQLTLPNGTIATMTPISGWTNITQIQTGNVAIITPITLSSSNKYVLQSASTVLLTGNIVQTETWSHQTSYAVSFQFSDNSGSIILSPQPSSFTLQLSNGTNIASPQGTTLVSSGVTTLLSVTWEGSNVLPSPIPTVSITSNRTYSFNLRVYQTALSNSMFLSNNGTTLANSPTAFKVTAPNSTLIQNTGTFMLQNGTFAWTIITYNGLGVSPGGGFDPSNGNPTVTVKVLAQGDRLVSSNAGTFQTITEIPFNSLSVTSNGITMDVSNVIFPNGRWMFTLQQTISASVPRMTFTSSEPSYVLNALNYTWNANALILFGQNSIVTITVDFNTLGPGLKIYESTAPITSVSYTPGNLTDTLIVSTSGPGSVFLHVPHVNPGAVALANVQVGILTTTTVTYTKAIPTSPKSTFLSNMQTFDPTLLIVMAAVAVVIYKLRPSRR